MSELSLASPELVEKAALFHLIEKAAVHEILRPELSCPWIHFRDFVEDRLEGVRLEIEPWLQCLDLRIVGRIQELSVRNPPMLAQDLVGKLLVRVENVRGLGHRPDELPDGLRASSYQRPAGREGGGRGGEAALPAVDQRAG